MRPNEDQFPLTGFSLASKLLSGVLRRISAAVAIMVTVFGFEMPGTHDVRAIEFGPSVREQGQLRLQWTGDVGPFQLEEAPAPSGPWQSLGAPGSDHSVLVPLARPERYFRVAGGGISSGEASMRETLMAIDTFSATVPFDNRPAWRSQMLAFLKARPDINDAGETPDGIWAITTDGVPLALWNNRLPDPAGEDNLGLVSAQGTETPGMNPARFAITVGAGFTHAAPRLGRLLRSNGYTITTDDGQLASLKGVRNEPVLFLNTHGGVTYIPLFGQDGKPSRQPDNKIRYSTSYGLWTGTKIDPTKTDFQYSHDEFVEELKAGRMALVKATASYQTGTGGVQSPIDEWRFCITDEWIRKYIRFPAANHASVWLAVCRSGSSEAAPLRAAFREVGAEMVSSWTESVKGEAVLAATSFVFDRMLGANQVLPPATPQRPFNYESVWGELQARGLHRHSTINDQGVAVITEIVYQGAAGDETFGVFAPSISHVLVDEGNNQLQLIGLFGKPDATERQVLIGGQEAPISSWEPRKIVCTLDRTGPRSAGDVQVIVRAHKSNIRQLSRWTLTGAYKMIEEGTPHVIDGNMTLIFRADVGEYRKDPGNVFIRPTRYALATLNSEVRLEAKGVESTPCQLGASETITWSGEGLFPIRDYTQPTVSGYHTIVGLSLNTIDHVGGLGIGFGNLDPTDSPLKVTFTSCEGDSISVPIAPVPPGSLEQQQTIKSPTEDRLPDGTEMELYLPGGSFSFGVDWAIPAGKMQNEIGASFTWNTAQAEFPPDPKAAR
jgi:hypothetical protein